MIYDAPQPPKHAIGTAVLKTNYRGGHAVAPHRLVASIVCRVKYRKPHPTTFRCVHVYPKPSVVG